MDVRATKPPAAKPSRHVPDSVSLAITHSGKDTCHGRYEDPP
jgi:hypothetical protein